MRLYWTPEAEQDRQDIWDFIASDSVQAAARMDALFARAAETLGNFPQAGRMGRIAGTREIFPHENYRLVYEVAKEELWVLALVHTSRMWPPARS